MTPTCVRPDGGDKRDYSVWKINRTDSTFALQRRLKVGNIKQWCYTVSVLTCEFHDIRCLTRPSRCNRRQFFAQDSFWMEHGAREAKSFRYK